MAQFVKTVWNHGFKLYFAFCLLSFTLIILLINVTHVFALEAAATPTQPPSEKISALTDTTTIPQNFYRWNLSPADASKFQETYVEFRGNKMLLKVRF
jgi:hypothetical protein